MKPLFFAILTLVSTTALAETAFSGGQIASLVNYESTAARPDSNGQLDNLTSIVSAGMEFTTPKNISVYGGFAFVLGETFETAIFTEARYYSATPVFQTIIGVPIWSYIGAGVSFLDDPVYYPEAGFRAAVSDTSRIDLFIKILNSRNSTYDKHVMIGAGLTF